MKKLLLALIVSLSTIAPAQAETQEELRDLVLSMFDVNGSGEYLFKVIAPFSGIGSQVKPIEDSSKGKIIHSVGRVLAIYHRGFDETGYTYVRPTGQFRLKEFKVTSNLDGPSNHTIVNIQYVRNQTINVFRFQGAVNRNNGNFEFNHAINTFPFGGLLTLSFQNGYHGIVDNMIFINPRFNIAEQDIEYDRGLYDFRINVIVN